MKLKRARKLIVSALLDSSEKRNRFFWVFTFHVSITRIGGDAMDDLLIMGGFVLGCLAATFGYLILYLFDFDNA